MCTERNDTAQSRCLHAGAPPIHPPPSTFHIGGTEYHHSTNHAPIRRAGNRYKVSAHAKTDSFTHFGYFYSASSSPLLLTGAPDIARILCRSFTPKATMSEGLAQGPNMYGVGLEPTTIGTKRAKQTTETPGHTINNCRVNLIS